MVALTPELGQIQNYLPNGYGKLTRGNVLIFEGNFVNGIFNGGQTTNTEKPTPRYLFSNDLVGREQRRK
jgi:hypothetical protein